MTTVKTLKSQSSRSSITRTNSIFVHFPNLAILTSPFSPKINQSLQSKTTCLVITLHPTHLCFQVPKTINLVSTSLIEVKIFAVLFIRARVQESVNLFHRRLRGEIFFIISPHTCLSGHRYCIFFYYLISNSLFKLKVSQKCLAGIFTRYSR